VQLDGFSLRRVSAVWRLTLAWLLRCAPQCFRLPTCADPAQTQMPPLPLLLQGAVAPMALAAQKLALRTQPWLAFQLMAHP
jgi:hypothetical protein